MTQPKDRFEQATVERVIRPKHRLAAIDFAELWRYRELMLFMAWRDILVRYKQTALGILWAVLQPIMIMIVFTILFGKGARFPSNGAPYAVMTFAALLPWNFFSNAVSQSGQSLVNAANLVRKVYCPRILIPVSAMLSGLVDLLIALVILFALMLHYGLAFHPRLLLLPAFTLQAFLVSLGLGLWLGALNVKYRDVRHIIPFFIRIGLYVSPVGFSSSIVPEKWRFLYSLNPMVGAIEGFRWSILGDAFEPYWPGFRASLLVTGFLVVTGAYYFRAVERDFADVI